MKVVVTGGAGRLGRSVVAGLAGAGHEVVSLDRVRGSRAGRRRRRSRWTSPTRPPPTPRFGRIRPEAVVHLAAIATPFSAPEAVIWDTNTSIAFHVMQAAVSHGASRILAASSPTPLGYGNPHGLAADVPADRRAAPAAAVERLRPLQGRHRAIGRDVRRAAREQPSPLGCVPAVLRDLARRVARARRPSRATPSPSGWPTRRWPRCRCSTTSTPAMPPTSSTSGWRAAADLPNGETFFVGAADALATEPLAELVPRFLPGTEELAAGLTGSTPAFSIAKAESLLGWRPTRTWRTELAPFAMPIHRPSHDREHRSSEPRRSAVLPGHPLRPPPVRWIPAC